MAAVQPPTKPCHNCRRQRLRCDRSFPRCNKCLLAGKECLGYGQLFRWTGAVASRGKFAGRTSTANDVGQPESEGSSSRESSATPGQSPPKWTLGSDTVMGSEASHEVRLVHAPSPDRSGHSPPALGELSSPWVLADPLFQDLSHSYRYYLSYFTTRVCKDLVSYDLPEDNPFRALIPLTRAQPLLQHLLVSASAAHMSVLVRVPLLDSENTVKATIPSNLDVAKVALQDSMVAKQKALQLMNHAVQNIESIGADVVLAAALFFVNLELIESGKHGWRAHLEGAGRIMSMLPPGRAADEALRNYVLSDCFIYHILASAFMPLKASSFASLKPEQMPALFKQTAAYSYICSPPEILEVLYTASQLAAAANLDTMATDEAAAAGAALIRKAQSFDIRAWAADLHRLPQFSRIPVESRFHAGSSHCLAACLYTIQAIPDAGAYLGEGAGERLSKEILEHLAMVPDDDPNFKATTWPTFIAGAEAKDPQTRAWIMNRLRRLLFWCPWGFLYTAIETLEVIWSLDGKRGNRGWVQTLTDPDVNFLIV